MSPTIFIIAFIPAFIAYWVGVSSGSKFILFVASVIAAAVGALTGDPAYTITDIAFVVIAFLIGLNVIQDKNRSKPTNYRTKIALPVEAVKKPSTAWSGIFLAIAIGGYITHNKFANTPAAIPPHAAPLSQQPNIVPVPQPYVPKIQRKDADQLGNSIDRLSSEESLSLSSACYEASMQGPAALNQCQQNQLQRLQQVQRVNTNGLSSEESLSLSSACYEASMQGPAALNQCQRRQLSQLGK